MYRTTLGDVTPPDYSSFLMPAEPAGLEAPLIPTKSGGALFDTGSYLYPLSVPAPGMTQAQANQQLLSVLSPGPASVPPSGIPLGPSPVPAGTVPNLSQQFNAWLATGNNKLILVGAGAAFLVAALAAKKRRR